MEFFPSGGADSSAAGRRRWPVELKAQVALTYVWLYNQQLLQSALRSKTPLQAMKDWVVSREVVWELATTCFFMAGGAPSLSGDLCRRVWIVAHCSQLFHRHVTAGDGPLVILVQHRRTDEADHGLTVRE